MIRAKNTSLIYADGTAALKPFDLTVGKGEVVYITGPSGSGKTSLLKLMMGIAFPSSGAFEVLGQNMKPQYEGAIRRMRQQIEKRYLENGSFYVLIPALLREQNNRLGGKIGMHLMERHKMFQIDRPEDIKLCAAIMRSYGYA